MSERAVERVEEVLRTGSIGTPQAGEVWDVEARPADISERAVGTHLSSRKVGEEGEVSSPEYVQIDSNTTLKTADDNFPAVIRIGSGPNATYEYADPQVRAQKAQELAEIRRARDEAEHQLWLREHDPLVLKRVSISMHKVDQVRQERERKEREKDYERRCGASDRYYDDLEARHKRGDPRVSVQLREIRDGKDQVIGMEQIYTEHNDWDDPQASRRIW